MKFVSVLFSAFVLQCTVANPVPGYKELTPEEAERLASWTPESNQPMWQLSGQFEGDIIIPPGSRNGIIGRRYRWNRGEIPYKFSRDFTKQEKEFIINALETGFGKTCIKIRPKTLLDFHYVYITGKNSGCWSYIGKQIVFRQQLNLQRNGCLSRGTVVHEFIHAAGFWHQQSATERDNYVTIQWQNIIKGQQHNFEKQRTENYQTAYDYGSLMHYSRTAFSANGEPTILPKDPNAEIGQNEGPSSTDLLKLMRMYKC